ncbi:hypothetical protein ACFPOI_05650 [Nonomuraea angiospora]|uniref:WD40 repeat domain-containing protein n=1 Tax=Nonomuraea angiospora TaxID=46172 RepID=A0ABR9MD42_9ACTN|nr:hypothetical protein [Nonomuraea angiospora]MBE1590500.1 hypothetical protein [Nonomuraea angiospora]
MTRLREALSGLAEEAPLVSLADAAIAGHRRRRRATMAATTVATIAALVASVAVGAVVWPRDAYPAAPQSADTVADLPDGKVGAVEYGYKTPCDVSEDQQVINCRVQEWRVVTRAGTTYRVPQALVSTRKGGYSPIAISRDGRMLAYYSREAQAHVVRDLTTGTVTTSPFKVKEEQIQIGTQLVVSDDGRYVGFDPRVGSKRDTGLVIDVRTGKTVRVPDKFEIISIKDGIAELVRYVKTDMWLMPVIGGGKPVRFDGTFILFSEIAPDGRTLVAHDYDDYKSKKLTLTVLDAKTGRIVRKVPVRGLPKNSGFQGATVWQSPSEVVIVSGSKHYSTYVVNIQTGKARHLADYDNGRMNGLILPGKASGK